jgi:hypothetical protein
MTAAGLRQLQDLRRSLLEPPAQLRPRTVTAAQPDGTTDDSSRLAAGRGPVRDGVTLRLLWPRWQGAGTSSVRELASEFPP